MNIRCYDQEQTHESTRCEQDKVLRLVCQVVLGQRFVEHRCFSTARMQINCSHARNQLLNRSLGKESPRLLFECKSIQQLVY